MSAGIRGGLRLSAIELPEVLFMEHPERRYYSDGVYSSEDADRCRKGAEKVVKEMVRLHLDVFFKRGGMLKW